MLCNLSRENKDSTKKCITCLSPHFLFLHRFLRADRNCPWHMIASVSPASSKALQIYPARGFTYVASASSHSAILTLILSAHTALTQPDNLNGCSRRLIRGDHFIGEIEQSARVVIKERWYREGLRGRISRGWDCVAISHFRQTEWNTAPLSRLSDSVFADIRYENCTTFKG